MFLGALKAAPAQMVERNTKLIRYFGSPHGNLSLILRLFWNCLLSFIFLYVDIIMLEVDPGSNSGGYILIIIAYFGALTIGVKTFLALCYHLKWMLVEKCCDNGLINSN